MSDSNCSMCGQTPTEVTYIENHWPHLQPHVREAIMTLIDGALNLRFSSASAKTDQATVRDG